MQKSESGFVDFLKSNNIITTIVATVISERISDVSSSLIECLFLPILNRDADGDGEADIKNIKDFQIKISGINFKIGEFTISLLKFIFILFMIYQVNKILTKKLQ
jgi:large-conductance mechanosensitive channel